MTYRYRKIDHFLVRVKPAISDVLRIFLLGYDRYRLDSLGMSRSVVRKVIKYALVSRLRSADSSAFVTLPVAAHVGKQVHRGYKLFDFDRSEVTKVFSSEITRDESAEEIRASRIASAFSLAPRHIGAESNSAWFTEEYISGTHGTDLVSAVSSQYLKYIPEAENCLLELACSRPPNTVSIRTHVEYLASDSWFVQWDKAGVSAEDRDALSTYLRALRGWIISNAEFDELPLVLTHGDFSLVNTIATNDGLRFIDWEGIRPGTIYSDIYNFVFTEHYYGRTSTDFVAEVHSEISGYRAAINRSCPELSGAAAINERVARRLYYLERTRLMIDREVTPNLIKVIAKSIAMFRQFDTDLGDPLP